MRENDNVAEEINRSKTYLLPLLSGYIRLTNVVVTNLYNTYIYYGDQSDLNHFYLTFHIDGFDRETFKNIQEDLKESTLYKETIVDNGTAIFKFRFPTEYIDDYNFLIEGKFSRIQKGAKQKIILFLEKHFPSEYQTLTIIKYILFKSERLKKTMETNLDVRLHEDSELGSKFNLREETYKFSKLNNSEEKEN